MFWPRQNRLIKERCYNPQIFRSLCLEWLNIRHKLLLDPKIGIFRHNDRYLIPALSNLKILRKQLFQHAFELHLVDVEFYLIYSESTKTNSFWVQYGTIQFS